MTRPRFVDERELEDVLAELREYADAGRAASRGAVGRAVVELEARLGSMIHGGRHYYVSTYCQHAADLAALDPIAFAVVASLPLCRVPADLQDLPRSLPLRRARMPLPRSA